jgi:mannitol/fructose-specific phosphotransferase system IIA component (Ntr-type)
MTIPSSTDNGVPVRCDVCGESTLVRISLPPKNTTCPNCGSFLWVNAVAEVAAQFQFVPDIRLRRLIATNRNGAIREMVDAFATNFEWPAKRAEEFNAEILRREELSSTGIGYGFAVPHGSHEGIDRSVTAVGYLPSSIDFNSLDDVPVHTVIMIASPKSDPVAHVKMLERISRLLRSLIDSAT